LITVPAQKSSGASGDNRAAVNAKAMITQLQKLVDTRPIGIRVPLEWAVGAYFFGDLSGLAYLSLRADTIAAHS
jgi:hypothetical protein